MVSDRLALDSLTPLHWIGVVAALTSAIVHLVLGLVLLPGAFGIAFLVAAVGFLLGIVAVAIDYRRRLIYALGVPFTGGQLVLWFWLNQPIPPVSPVEALDKLAQAVLIVVLVVLLDRER